MTAEGWKPIEKSADLQSETIFPCTVTSADKSFSINGAVFELGSRRAGELRVEIPIIVSPGDPLSEIARANLEALGDMQTGDFFRKLGLRQEEYGQRAYWSSAQIGMRLSYVIYLRKTYKELVASANHEDVTNKLPADEKVAVFAGLVQERTGLVLSQTED